MTSKSPRERIVVDVATNGSTWDHANWADARFTKSAQFSTTQLEKALNKAESIDLNNYTQESMEALESAINTGKEALASANQEIIDRAVEKLNEAMDSLVKVDLN